MTLKSITQLTNIGWMIGGVSALTSGYSYYNSKKDKISVIYSQKKLEKISSLEDIEDYQAQKGCQFVFFTKKADISSDLLKNHNFHYTALVARHNEWIDGGVLSAREYVNKNDGVNDTVINLANDAKEKCTNGQIIYREVDKANLVRKQ